MHSVSNSILFKLFVAFVTIALIESSDCGMLKSGAFSWAGTHRFHGCIISGAIVTISPSDALTIHFDNVTWTGGYFTVSKSTIDSTHIYAQDSRFTEATGNMLCVSATGSISNVTLSIRSSLISTSQSALSVIGSSSVAHSLHITVVDSSVSGSAASYGAAVGVAMSTGLFLLSNSSFNAVRSSVLIRGSWQNAALGVIIAEASSRLTLRNVVMRSVASTVACRGGIGAAAMSANLYSRNGFGTVEFDCVTIEVSHSRISATSSNYASAVGLHAIGSTTSANTSLTVVNSTVSTTGSGSSCAGASGIGAHTAMRLRVCKSSLMSPGMVLDVSGLSNAWSVTVLNASISSGSKCLSQTIAPESAIRDSHLVCNAAGNSRGTFFGLFVSNLSGSNNHDIAATAFPGAERDPTKGPYTSLHSCPMWLSLGESQPASSTPSRSTLQTATHSLTLTWTPSPTQQGTESQTQSATDSATSTNTVKKKSVVTSTVTTERLLRYRTQSFDRNTSTASITRIFGNAVELPATGPRRKYGMQAVLPVEASSLIMTVAIISSLSKASAGSGTASASAVVNTPECSLMNEVSEPSRFDMPIQMNIGADKLNRHAGSVLLTTVTFVLPPFGLHYLMWKRDALVPSSRWLKIAAKFHASTIQYFVPTCAGVASLLISRGRDVEIGVGVIVLVVLACQMWILFRRLAGATLSLRYATQVPQADDASDVDGDVDTVSRNSSDTSPSSLDEPRVPIGSEVSPTGRLAVEAAAYLAAMSSFLDDCRRLEIISTRLYSLEEMCVAIAICIVTSIQRGGCGGVSIAVVVIASLHILYLIAVRPYKRKLDAFFSMLGAVLLLALAVLVAAEMLRKDSDETVLTIAVLQTAAILLFPAQFIIQNGWSLYVTRRRRPLTNAEPMRVSSKGTLDVPLLTKVGEFEPIVSDHPLQVANPIHRLA